MTRSTKSKTVGRKPALTQARVKIAISLPPEQVAKAQQAVDEGRSPSVSAYVARAIERQAHADALGELLASMRAEDGAPSAADYAWADSALGIVGGSRKRSVG
jgi:Arc/MetJ-type ribon-helix-helix transcriptional regulator